MVAKNPSHRHEDSGNNTGDIHCKNRNSLKLRGRMKWAESITEELKEGTDAFAQIIAKMSWISNIFPFI